MASITSPQRASTRRYQTGESRARCRLTARATAILEPTSKA